MSPWDSIDRIYLIANPEKEQGRIQSVTASLMHHGCPNEKISICCPTWGDRLSREQCLNVYDPYLPRAWPSLNYKCRWLLKGEISLVLNFFGAIHDASLRGFQQIMVLESDVLLRKDFGERFGTLMELAKEADYDYISLSDGVGTHSEGFTAGLHTNPQKLLPPSQEHRQFPFRCTDSMILKKRAIEYLSRHLLPFRDCLDWELNYRFAEFGGKALWAEPHLVEQATQKRVALSSLRH